MFRIVIVEDEPLILQSIADKIRLLDPDFKIVGEYENGEYAMLELDLVKPHVILTDIYMPIMDGLSLIRHVKKAAPSTLCAILTGYRDFDFARQALQLGVTDFLLKPPTVESLGKLLSDVKEQLWENQTLIEAELLAHWSLHRDDKIGSPRLRKLAQEYFYHAHYIVVHAWIPPQQEAETLEASDGMKPRLRLKEGEKAYELSAVSERQRTLIVGVHRPAEARLRELLDDAERLFGAPSVCLSVVIVEKLQTELASAIAKLRRLSYAAFPLEGTRKLVVSEAEPSYEISTLPIPSSLEQEMGSLLAKQRKTDFLRKLESLLLTDAWLTATRAQWLQTLTFLTNSWLLHDSGFVSRMAPGNWSQELDDVVWQAKEASSLIGGLKELYSAFFDSFDRESEAPWTEEVKALLENRYIENISLMDLAERFELNPSYLSRVFKSKYGQSPIDYLIQLRLSKARQLIRDKPRLLFKDIAEMVGYADPFYFSKLFKQWTGQTPREYKKSFRG